MPGEANFDNLSEFEIERVSFYSSEKYASFMEKGKYNCSKCKASLYSSDDKFIANAPLDEFVSFRNPISQSAVTSKRVYSFGMKRTEATCAACGLHLGYIFPDGKESGDTHPEAGERHCILSVSINFVGKQADKSPEFGLEPEEVLEHLKAQDQEAERIIAAGESVELQVEQEEEKPKPAESEKKEEKKKEIKQEKKPEKKNEPKLTRKDTPIPKGKGKASPSPRPTPSSSSSTFSSNVQKPQSSQSQSTIVPYVAPVALAVIGATILYFAYKITQEKKD